LVLDEFRYNGLYIAEPDERGIWHVKKRRLSQEKYDILKEHYKRVDENGYTPEELRQTQIDEKNESKISKIWKLIKSLSGY
jgi:DNA-directed RNA polymerase specialized sigma54-like protein